MAMDHRRVMTGAAGEHVSKAIAPTYPPRVAASGYAKKLAKAKGVDLAAITGSGPGGRVVARDVEAFTPPEPTPFSPTTAPDPRKLQQWLLVRPRLALPRSDFVVENYTFGVASALAAALESRRIAGMLEVGGGS